MIATLACMSSKFTPRPCQCLLFHWSGKTPCMGMELGIFLKKNISADSNQGKLIDLFSLAHSSMGNFIFVNGKYGHKSVHIGKAFYRSFADYLYEYKVYIMQSK